MAFEVTINEFEGPLDLMLHLIKENKLDLLDLDMNVLTTQYLDFINKMESLSLVVASEYLSELAGLIEYKSKKLIPREELIIEDEFEEDHSEKLRRRLIEYKKFKEVSKEFLDSYEYRQKMYDKPISEEAIKLSVPIEDSDTLCGNPYDLIKAMQKVIRRKNLNQPIESTMQLKELSVDERRIVIEDRVKQLNSKLSFEDLCDDCDTLDLVIVTFLAILDLIKYKVITFTIDEQENIWIKRCE